MESRVVFPNRHTAKKTLSNWRAGGVFFLFVFVRFSLLFLNNTGKRKYILLPQPIAAGYRSNSYCAICFRAQSETGRPEDAVLEQAVRD